jgi:hypothetical protein
VSPEPKVAVAYLHPGEVSAAFSMSLLKLMLHETFRTGMPPLVVANRCASGNIPAGRNEITAQVLDGTDCEWLLFIDADMGFAPDSLERLLAEGSAERPVIGGLCFAVKRTATDPETHAERFQCMPTLYAWREFPDRVGFQVVENYERDAMVLVGATGAAFLLIHRSVLEKIREVYGDRWFDRIPHELPKPHGTLFSEDMSFCIRVAGVDAPLYVHTGVKTCHDKGGRFYDEAEWDAQMRLLAPAEPVAAVA